MTISSQVPLNIAIVTTMFIHTIIADIHCNLIVIGIIVIIIIVVVVVDYDDAAVDVVVTTVHIDRIQDIIAMRIIHQTLLAVILVSDIADILVNVL
jgi:hypothetical protein